MIYTDHLFGSFDSFQTDVQFDEATQEWVASAQGYEARHQFQELALNDLNSKIFDAVSRGELVPGMGN